MLEHRFPRSTFAMADHPRPEPSSADVQSRVEEAAQRALAEAAARREAAILQPPVREIDGRKGPEPVRYGDWESKGLACDF
jgi:hypothetical protein